MMGDAVSIRSPDTFASQVINVLRRLHRGDGLTAVQVPWNLLNGEVEVPDEWDPGVISTKGANRGASSPRRERRRGSGQPVPRLGRDRSPVVLAGRGAVRANARKALEELAERTGAILMTTHQAKRYFADHPVPAGFIRMFGISFAN